MPSRFSAPVPLQTRRISPAFRDRMPPSLCIEDVLGQFRLGRREAALGDGEQGVQLVEDIVVRARPSVSRDGSLAVFVNAENDLCFIATDGNRRRMSRISNGVLSLPIHGCFGCHVTR